MGGKSDRPPCKRLGDRSLVIRVYHADASVPCSRVFATSLVIKSAVCPRTANRAVGGVSHSVLYISNAVSISTLRITQALIPVRVVTKLPSITNNTKWCSTSGAIENQSKNSSNKFHSFFLSVSKTVATAPN